MGGKQSSSYYNSPGVSPYRKKQKSRKTTSYIEEYDAEYDLEPVNELTDREKELIKKTWNKIEMDAERVGANTFSNLFRIHPSVKEEFVPFRSIDVKDEKYNMILQEHGVRVMSTFGKMVRRIDDEETIIPMLRELGTRHGAIYNAKSSLIGMIGPHFLRSIQQCLGKEWTGEIEMAYNHMFEILTYHMKQALHKASINHRIY